MYKLTKITVTLLMVIVLFGHAIEARQRAKDITFKPNKEIQTFLKGMLSSNKKKLFSGTKDQILEKLNQLEEMVNGRHEKLTPELLYFSMKSKNRRNGMLTYAVIKYLNISKSSIFTGLLPYVDAKDKTLRKMLDSGLNFVVRGDYGKIDFSLFETIIRENKSNVPYGLIKFMYDNYLEIALSSMANIYLSKKEATDLIDKTKDFYQDKALCELSQRQEWWIQLYIVRKMRRNLRLWSPEIIEKVKMSRSTLVQEELSALLELTNLFANKKKGKLRDLDIQRISELEHREVHSEIKNILSKLANDPENVELLLKLASLEENQQNYMIAVGILHKIINIDPTITETYSSLNNVYRRLGDLKASLANSYMNIELLIYNNKKRKQLEIEKLESELAKNPDNVPLLSNLVTKELRQEDFETAEIYLKCVFR